MSLLCNQHFFKKDIKNNSLDNYFMISREYQSFFNTFVNREIKYRSGEISRYVV